MDREQEKEIIYLVCAITGPVFLAVLIAAGSPTHNCCSFFPELLMIIIPGAYCFYALRGILNLRLRTALLVFALITATAVLTVAKTVPLKEKEETEEENRKKKKEPKLELQDTRGQRDFKTISSALKQGFK